MLMSVRLLVCPVQTCLVGAENASTCLFGAGIGSDLSIYPFPLSNHSRIFTELIDSTCGKYDEGSDYDNVISVISGALTIITGSLGISGNLISIVVLCQKYNSSQNSFNISQSISRKMCNVFNTLLLALCVVDLFVILSNLPLAVSVYSELKLPR